jgi:hypothetical protein
LQIRKSAKQKSREAEKQKTRTAIAKLKIEVHVPWDGGIGVASMKGAPGNQVELL